MRVHPTLRPHCSSRFSRRCRSGLSPCSAYYWKIVSKTIAGKTASGPVWSFGT
jgi:hypothetical protein